MADRKPRKTQRGGKKAEASPRQPVEPKKGPREAPQQPKRAQREPKQTASAAAADRYKFDPIVKASFIVFLLATLIVVGATVNDKFLSSESTRVGADGDTIRVEYVGSLGGYYDGEDYLIFDTNIKSVYDNPEYTKAASLVKTEFSPLDVKLTEKTNVLKLFRDALYGKKVGDIVRFMIPVDQGYPTPLGPQTQSYTSEMPINMFDLDIPAAKAYIKDAPATLENDKRYTSVFGWEVLVTGLDKGRCTLSNIAEVKEYEYSEALKINVTGIAGDMVAFEYVLTEKGKADIDGKIGVQVVIGGKERFVSAYDDAGFTYNLSAASDSDLFFVVKVVGFA